MPRVPNSAMRTDQRCFVARVGVSAAANFFGAGLLTGSNANQLAMYSSVTLRRLMISRRFSNTLRQLLKRNENARSEVCSQSRQQLTTTVSRAVIEKKLRQ